MANSRNHGALARAGDAESISRTTGEKEFGSRRFSVVAGWSKDPAIISHRHPSRQRRSATALAFLVFLAWIPVSCTHYTGRKQRLDARLVEAARVNNQAASDALHLQPTERRDEHTATALEFMTQNGRVLGPPGTSEPVEPLLAERRKQAIAAADGQEAKPGPASRKIADLFEEQDRLVREQRRLADKLQALGEKGEAARNSRISFWTRWMVFAAGPLGLVIAMLVLFPMTAPILGRLLAWVVGKLPAMAGYIGVVGTKAFDATVRGIEQFKTASGLDAIPGASPAPAAVSAAATAEVRSEPSAEAQGSAAGVPPANQLAAALSRSMDGEHKALVRERRRKI